MQLRRLLLNPWFCFAVLALVFFALEPTPLEIRVGGLPLDLWIQDHFFNFATKQWLVNKKAQPWKFFLYDGMLIALYGFAAVCAGLLFVPKRKWLAWGRADAWYADKWKLAYVIACMALVTGLVGLSKAVTDIYVPFDMVRYPAPGSKLVPHVRVLEHYPVEFLARRAAEHMSRGKSFPAGHASGGFSLLSLFFVLPGRWRWFGLGLALGVGWVTGVYKMAMGDHYFSHTLITCLWAWCACVALVKLWKYLERRHYLSTMPA